MLLRRLGGFLRERAPVAKKSRTGGTYEGFFFLTTASGNASKIPTKINSQTNSINTGVEYNAARADPGHARFPRERARDGKGLPLSVCGARAERARASAKRCRAPRATAVDFASSDTPAFFSRVAIFSNCVSSAELVRQAFRPNERVRDARRSDPGAMAGDAPPGVSVRRQSGARPPSPRRSPRRSFDRLPDFPVRPPSRRARFLDVRLCVTSR